MTPPGLTVLLAEDSDDMRMLMKIILEFKGCRVLEAVNGRQAIEQATHEKPDLILMDLSMPELNGWEATRELRQLPDMQATPIIGLSAYCQGSWFQEAISAGCDDCLQKPIEDQVFDQILSRFSKR